MSDFDERGVPNVVVDRRIDVGLHLAGTVAVVAAAYHAGRTGDPYPLFAVCAILSLVVLFVTSDE